jgi:hypothetical protein
MAEVLKIKEANGAAGKPKEPPVARRNVGWKVREAARNTFVHVADDGATIEDVKRQGYFDLVAKDLRQRDRIEVYAPDNSWLAEFVVLDAGMGWAQVHMRSLEQLPPATMSDPDGLAGYEFQRDGKTGDWFAIRKMDRQEMGRGHQLKAKKDLVRFIEDHAATRQPMR